MHTVHTPTPPWEMSSPAPSLLRAAISGVGSLAPASPSPTFATSTWGIPCWRRLQELILPRPAALSANAIPPECRLAFHLFWRFSELLYTTSSEVLRLGSSSCTSRSKGAPKPQQLWRRDRVWTCGFLRETFVDWLEIEGKHFGGGSFVCKIRPVLVQMMGAYREEGRPSAALMLLIHLGSMPMW